jgi:hypothetical protein
MLSWASTPGTTKQNLRKVFVINTHNALIKHKVNYYSFQDLKIIRVAQPIHDIYRLNYNTFYKAFVRLYKCFALLNLFTPTPNNIRLKVVRVLQYDFYCYTRKTYFRSKIFCLPDVGRVPYLKHRTSYLCPKEDLGETTLNSIIGGLWCTCINDTLFLLATSLLQTCY